MVTRSLGIQDAKRIEESAVLLCPGTFSNCMKDPYGHAHLSTYCSSGISDFKPRDLLL